MHDFFVYIIFAIHQASFDHVKVGRMPFLALHNLWRNLHMFLEILELWVEDKIKSVEKNYFDNVVSDVWQNGLNCLENLLENKYF